MKTRIPFSLVTTCRNEMRSLHRWRDNLLAQTRSPDEIVIVDAFSDDGTAESLSEWSKADKRVVFLQEKGAAAHGRNFAIEHASHEHILSTDMGVRLSDNWCEELIKPFENDNTFQVVIGNTCIDVETVKSAVARAEYYIENGGFANPRPGSIAGNRSVAYLKSVWRELGGLPEDLTFYADDSVFGRQIVQAGYITAYAPEAMTYWGRPRKLNQFWKEVYGYGVGDGEAAIKTPAPFRYYQKGYLPRFLVPPLTALRFGTKQLKKLQLKKVIENKDFTALIITPLLVFGNGWYFGKGYLKGDLRGRQECLECRKRLTGEPHLRSESAKAVM